MKGFGLSSFAESEIGEQPFFTSGFHYFTTTFGNNSAFASSTAFLAA
jgi:hypothetical protein